MKHILYVEFPSQILTAKHKTINCIFDACPLDEISHNIALIGQLSEIKKKSKHRVNSISGYNTYLLYCVYYLFFKTATVFNKDYLI